MSQNELKSDSSSIILQKIPVFALVFMEFLSQGATRRAGGPVGAGTPQLLQASRPRGHPAPRQRRVPLGRAEQFKA